MNIGQNSNERAVAPVVGGAILIVVVILLALLASAGLLPFIDLLGDTSVASVESEESPTSVELKLDQKDSERTDFVKFVDAEGDITDENGELITLEEIGNTANIPRENISGTEISFVGVTDDGSENVIGNKELSELDMGFITGQINPFEAGCLGVGGNEMTISDTSGQEITTVETDEQGFFTVEVPTGFADDGSTEEYIVEFCDTTVPVDDDDETLQSVGTATTYTGFDFNFSGYGETRTTDVDGNVLPGYSVTPIGEGGGSSSPEDVCSGGSATTEFGTGEDITVELIDQNGNLVEQTSSPNPQEIEDGDEYCFEDVSIGEYTIRADAENHYPEEITVNNTVDGTTAPQLVLKAIEDSGSVFSPVVSSDEEAQNVEVRLEYEEDGEFVPASSLSEVDDSKVDDEVSHGGSTVLSLDNQRDDIPFDIYNTDVRVAAVDNDGYDDFATESFTLEEESVMYAPVLLQSESTAIVTGNVQDTEGNKLTDIPVVSSDGTVDRTDETGTYSLEVTEEQIHKITVNDQLFEKQSTDVVEPSEDEIITRDFTVDPATGEYEILVDTEDDFDSGDVTVEIFDDETVLETETISEETSFEDTVRVGDDYRVELSGDSYVDQEVDFSVVRNDTAILNLELFAVQFDLQEDDTTKSIKVDEDTTFNAKIGNPTNEERTYDVSFEFGGVQIDSFEETVQAGDQTEVGVTVNPDETGESTIEWIVEGDETTESEEFDITIKEEFTEIDINQTLISDINNQKSNELKLEIYPESASVADIRNETTEEAIKQDTVDLDTSTTVDIPTEDQDYQVVLKETFTDEELQNEGVDPEKVYDPVGDGNQGLRQNDQKISSTVEIINPTENTSVNLTVLPNVVFEYTLVNQFDESIDIDMQQEYINSGQQSLGFTFSQILGIDFDEGETIDLGSSTTERQRTTLFSNTFISERTIEDYTTNDNIGFTLSIDHPEISLLDSSGDIEFDQSETDINEIPAVKDYEFDVIQHQADVEYSVVDSEERVAGEEIELSITGNEFRSTTAEYDVYIHQDDQANQVDTVTIDTDGDTLPISENIVVSESELDEIGHEDGEEITIEIRNIDMIDGTIIDEEVADANSTAERINVATEFREESVEIARSEGAFIPAVVDEENDDNFDSIQNAIDTLDESEIIEIVNPEEEDETITIDGSYELEYQSDDAANGNDFTVDTGDEFTQASIKSLESDGEQTITSPSGQLEVIDSNVSIGDQNAQTNIIDSTITVQTTIDSRLNVPTSVVDMNGNNIDTTEFIVVGGESTLIDTSSDQVQIKGDNFVIFDSNLEVDLVFEDVQEESIFFDQFFNGSDIDDSTMNIDEIVDLSFTSGVGEEPEIDMREIYWGTSDPNFDERITTDDDTDVLVSPFCEDPDCENKSQEEEETVEPAIQLRANNPEFQNEHDISQDPYPITNTNVTIIKPEDENITETTSEAFGEAGLAEFDEIESGTYDIEVTGNRVVNETIEDVNITSDDTIVIDDVDMETVEIEITPELRGDKDENIQEQFTTILEDDELNVDIKEVSMTTNVGDTFTLPVNTTIAYPLSGEADFNISVFQSIEIEEENKSVTQDATFTEFYKTAEVVGETPEGDTIESESVGFRIISEEENILPSINTSSFSRASYGTTNNPDKINEENLQQFVDQEVDVEITGTFDGFEQEVETVENVRIENVRDELGETINFGTLTPLCDLEYTELGTDEYEVSSSEELQCIGPAIRDESNDINEDSTFVQTEDIDLSTTQNPEGFIPVGGMTDDSSFEMNITYDGQDHSIENLSLDQIGKTENVGLFTQLENATVQNIQLKDAELISNPEQSSSNSLMTEEHSDTVFSNITVENSSVKHNTIIRNAMRLSLFGNSRGGESTYINININNINFEADSTSFILFRSLSFGGLSGLTVENVLISEVDAEGLSFGQSLGLRGIVSDGGVVDEVYVDGDTVTDEGEPIEEDDVADGVEIESTDSLQGDSVEDTTEFDFDNIWDIVSGDYPILQDQDE